jgi:hypothetical protein
MKPTTCATAYFKWNAQHHMHVIRHQMTFLDLAFHLLRPPRNTFPSYFRSSTCNLRRRPFGMNTTWYRPPIACGLSSRTRPSATLLSCAWRLTSWSFPMNSRKRQTSTASLAEQGELPDWFSSNQPCAPLTSAENTFDSHRTTFANSAQVNLPPGPKERTGRVLSGRR